MNWTRIGARGARHMGRTTRKSPVTVIIVFLLGSLMVSPANAVVVFPAIVVILTLKARKARRIARSERDRYTNPYSHLS